jgi:hypothetical protein
MDSARAEPADPGQEAASVAGVSLVDAAVYACEVGLRLEVMPIRRFKR